jgi:transposase
MADKDHLIFLLVQKNQELTAKVVMLEEKVALLLEENRKLSIERNSKNSSKPPSSDMPPPAKRHGAKRHSGRKPGGQDGHQGHTLEMRQDPDRVTELKSAYCSRCGAGLPGPQELLGRRQVVDIPPVKPVWHEYRQYGRTCACGHMQVADYPEGVKGPVQYGRSVEAVAAYLSAYQHIPFGRSRDFFSHMFGMPLSEGTLANLLSRSASRLEGPFQAIREKVASAKVVGSDESPFQVGGQTWWLWVWQTARQTLLAASPSRGAKVVDGQWPGGLPKAVLVSDRLPAQLKTRARGHQLCLAHLLREATYLQEAEAGPFAEGLATWIGQVYRHRAQWAEGKGPGGRAESLEATLDGLLAISLCPARRAGSLRLQKSLLRQRQWLVPTLYDWEVPPDNNASERAIRNVKVKMKVSGQFKRMQHHYCVIRSVIDTLLKNNAPVLPCLNLAHGYLPE